MSAFHLSVCPSGGTVGNASSCTFPRAQKHSNLTIFTFYCMSIIQVLHPKNQQEHARTTESTQYSCDLGTFRVALLFCYAQMNHVIVILSQVLGRVTLATPYCSESLHFVGLAISACLLPSLPRPTCTADSSAALTATAPVLSLVHAWPCSAPLQPLLPVPFPTPPLLVIFCAHLTFHLL
jgi:hypothetical protein